MSQGLLKRRVGLIVTGHITLGQYTFGVFSPQTLPKMPILEEKFSSSRCLLAAEELSISSVAVTGHRPRRVGRNATVPALDQGNAILDSDAIRDLDTQANSRHNKLIARIRTM
jgi:hypothetical protein